MNVEGIGEVYVSTVFLVFNADPIGEPRLFETMIFQCDDESGSLGQSAWEYQDRSTTREEAQEAHQLAVDFVYSQAP